MRQPIATSVAALGAAIALSWGMLACGRREPAADVAAEVGGEPVPYVEFEGYLAANAIVDAPSLDGKVLSSLFDQFLEELLLTRLAIDEGIEADSPRAAVARLIAKSSAGIEPGEVEAFFRENPDRFRRPESVRLRQILVEERRVAESAVREMAAGAAFEDVAGRLSQGPRAKKGGDQGVLTREDLPPEIASRIFELAPGEISDIIAAEYGFHVFQVSERYPEARMSIDVVHSEIVEEVEQRKRGETMRLLRERAAKRYNTRVFEGNLPFQYMGKYG